ncbi:MAG: hypothetical protein RBU30_12955 [Polyangia bacterium]|jgi:hypothetical protein|nr:hypothetical protein [Polyangia bacterium]
MDALTTLVEVLKTGGPYALSAIFVLVWWAERKDRQAKEDDLHAAYDRTVTLVRQSTRAVEQMQAAVSALKDAIQSMNGRLR